MIRFAIAAVLCGMAGALITWGVMRDRGKEHSASTSHSASADSGVELRGDDAERTCGLDELHGDALRLLSVQLDEIENGRYERERSFDDLESSTDIDACGWLLSNFGEDRRDKLCHIEGFLKLYTMLAVMGACYKEWWPRFDQKRSRAIDLGKRLLRLESRCEKVRRRGR